MLVGEIEACNPNKTGEKETGWKLHQQDSLQAPHSHGSVQVGSRGLPVSPEHCGSGSEDWDEVWSRPPGPSVPGSLLLTTCQHVALWSPLAAVFSWTRPHWGMGGMSKVPHLNIFFRASWSTPRRAPCWLLSPTSALASLISAPWVHPSALHFRLVSGWSLDSLSTQIPISEDKDFSSGRYWEDCAIGSGGASCREDIQTSCGDSDAMALNDGSSCAAASQLIPVITQHGGYSVRRPSLPRTQVSAGIAARGKKGPQSSWEIRLSFLGKERDRKGEVSLKSTTGLWPCVSVHKITAWEEVACRDVTQGPDPGPREPRAGLGRAGASAAEQGGDGGGAVWTSCWAGLHGGSQSQTLRLKGHELLRPVCGGPSAAGSCWMTVGRFWCWRCTGSESRGGAVVCPGPRGSPPDSQARLGDPLGPCVCDWRGPGTWGKSWANRTSWSPWTRTSNHGAGYWGSGRQEGQHLRYNLPSPNLGTNLIPQTKTTTQRDNFLSANSSDTGSPQFCWWQPLLIYPWVEGISCTFLSLVLGLRF